VVEVEGSAFVKKGGEGEMEVGRECDKDCKSGYL